MAGYYGSKEFIEWNPTKNQNYLKSEVMEELGKNPAFASVFRTTQDKRIIFEAMASEADRGKKKLTNEGMLRAIGMVREAGVVLTSQTKSLVRGLFPGISVPASVQRELVFGAGESEESEVNPESETSEVAEVPEGDGESSEPKRPKSILEILGF